MLRILSLGLVLTAIPAFAQELDVKKSKPAWNLMWEDDWVTAVVFATNNRLVAGNEKGDLLVWELPNSLEAKAPFPSRMLKGHTNGITKLRATPDGRYVISASKDKTIRFWDLGQPDAGAEAKIILDAKKRETNAKKNGKPIPETPPVSVKVQEAAKIFDLHKEWVLGLGMTPDARTIISGDDSGRVLVWDRETGKIHAEWKTKGWVHGLAISPDAQLAVVTEQRPLIFDSGRHTGCKVWDAVKGEVLKDLGTMKENFSSAAFSPDGTHFAIARSGETDNGKIYLFETKDFKKLKEYPGHMSGTNDLHFSKSGKYMITAGRDTTVKIWSVADGKLSLELGKPRGGQFKDIMHACAVSPDQRWVAGADMMGQVQVWKLGE